MRKPIIGTCLLVCLVVFVIVYMRSNSPLIKRVENKTKKETEVEDSLASKKSVYGFEVDTLDVIQRIFKPNQFVSDILLNYGLSYQRIDEMAKATRPIFDLRNIRAGNAYTILASPVDSGLKATHFIYEIDKVKYIVYDFRDTVIGIQTFNKPVEYKERTVSAVIESSLYEALRAQNINAYLATRLSEIYAWTIDFYRIQKNDKIKIRFVEKLVDGKSIGIEKIQACLFNHFGRDFYAFHYIKDSTIGADYYDEKGKALRRAFLKAPVKYTRISSRYSLRRYHPVQRRNKPHLGTDYAAPRGTSIYSTADGVVQKATYSRFNGKYVKIRHNRTYSTQYLHMSKIKSGIRPGVFVKQGEVIGYVGSTGLATGPHVCYRFWKHGKQVDPYKQNLPDAAPIGKKHYDTYMLGMEREKSILDSIAYPSVDV